MFFSGLQAVHSRFWHRDPEDGFLTGATDNRDRSPMRLHRPFHDGEAQTSSLNLILRVAPLYPIEALEHMRQVRTRNPHAIVDNLHYVLLIRTSISNPARSFCLSAFSTRLKNTWSQ